jgi:hypothetical protein
MNAYVAIQEQNKVYGWMPSPNEQYEQPPANAICWVSGDNEEILLKNARNKFAGLGFDVLGAEFYSPGPGEKSIHLIVNQRDDVSEFSIGDGKLTRLDMTVDWVAH